MEQERIFKCLMDKMFPYFYMRWCIDPSKLDFSDSPVFKGIMTKDFLHLIMKAILVHTSVASPSWMKFLNAFRDLLLSSPETYIMYVVSMCQIVADATTNIRYRFISIFSFVTTIAYYVSKKCVHFYLLTPKLLEAFYNATLKDEFFKQGGWKSLEGFLRSKKFAKWYIKLRNVTSPAETKRFCKEFLAGTGLKIVTFENFTLDIIRKKLYSDIVLDVTERVILTTEFSLLEALDAFVSKEKQENASHNESTLESESKINCKNLEKVKVKLELPKNPEASNNISSGSVKESKESYTCESNLLKLRVHVDNTESAAELSALLVSKDHILQDITIDSEEFKRKIESLISIFDSLLEIS